MGDYNAFELNRGGVDPNRKMMTNVIKRIDEFCNLFLRDPALEYVWKSKPDVILLTATLNDCGLAFVQKFKVPFIYVSTSGMASWVAQNMGNPEHPAYVPNQFLSYSHEMTFVQRLKNTYMNILTPILRKKLILNRLETTIQHFLNDSSFSISDVDKSASMTLVNNHHAFSFPRPLMPNTVDVGGMHCRKPRKIQEDRELRNFLDSSSKNSVLYFSLGSITHGTDMPAEIRDMFVKAFSQLPYKVLWKYEGDLSENLSSNVLTRPWIPQQDVLGHPSVGTFFSHSGMLSLQESIYHAVPLVALPLISDQRLNAQMVVNNKIGLQLDLKSLTADTIAAAIIEVMENSAYRTQVKKVSEVFKDNEVEPVKLAAYWVEYVLRHRGTKHLLPASKDLSFIQRNLLDVYAFIVAISASLFYLTFIVIRSIV